MNARPSPSLRTRFGTNKLLRLLPLLIALLLVPALSSEARTVRVGITNIDRFFEFSPDGPWGYGIDYLNKIARHTGWTYDYVPGNWTELLQRLQEGSIDLLFPAENSPERQKEFIFSKEYCCMDFVALYTRKNDTTYFYEDYAAYDGMTVGMLSDNQLNERFDAFLVEKNITVHRVYFHDLDVMKAALNEKKLDAIVYGVMNEDPDQKLLAKIDYMRAYFMMNRSNGALMAELDRALHSLLLEDPYFISKLYTQHYRDFTQQDVGFTREEAERIRKSGELVVACDDDRFPMSWYDAHNHQVKGIYPDILRRVAHLSGLQLRFIPLLGELDAVQMLQGGQAQVLSCIVDKGQNNLHASDSFYTARYSLIGRLGVPFHEDAALQVAIPANVPGLETFLKKHYPSWRFLIRKNERSCLEAVNTGKANMACVNSLALQIDPNLFLPADLRVVFTEMLIVPVSVGVSENNADLIPIINKSILKLTPEDIRQSILGNAIDAHVSLTFSDFIRQFPFLAAGCAILFTAMLLSFLFILYRNRETARQHHLLELSYGKLREVLLEREVIKRKSESDLLTGLYNKASFFRNAVDTMKKDKEVALIFFDVDNFKSLNDRYGHLVGDQILQNVAENLRHHFSDALLGRFGGDEFNILLPRTSRDILQGRLEAFSRALAEHSPIRKAFSVSAGIALSPEHGSTIDELLDKSDQALYHAKNSGKNQIRFYNQAEMSPEDTNSSLVPETF